MWKPVITTKNGGSEGIVKEFNGKVVDIDDIEAMAYAMKYIKNNYELYDSDLIRNDCINRFSNESVSNEIINIYEKIINGFGEKYEK